MGKNLRGRARKPVNPVPLTKLKRLVILIEKLKDYGLTVDNVAETMKVSPRTAYRYLQLIEEADLPLEKSFNDKYFICEKKKK